MGWEFLFGDLFIWFLFFLLRMIPRRPNGLSYDCMGARTVEKCYGNTRGPLCITVKADCETTDDTERDDDPSRTRCSGASPGTLVGVSLECGPSQKHAEEVMIAQCYLRRTCVP